MKTPVALQSILTGLSLVLVVAGCHQSTAGPGLDQDVALQPGNALLANEADLTLLAEADSFEPGAEVALTLVHHAGEQVGFNLCSHALERRNGDDWTMLEFFRICTAHLNLLSPGETAEYEAALPSGLSSGEYRFRIALYLVDGEDQRDLVSNSFEVQ